MASSTPGRNTSCGGSWYQSAVVAVTATSVSEVGLQASRACSARANMSVGGTAATTAASVNSGA
jgi:hypothetical protein